MTQKRKLVACVLVLAFLAMALPAAAMQYRYSARELDEIYAPIALYPDSLLGSIFVAASFPEQVVEANRLMQETDSLDPDERERFAAERQWDESIQSLLVTPDVLEMMADNMEWTQCIYVTFNDQSSDVYEAIQRLRTSAFRNGSLVSNDNVDVVRDSNGNILIGSTSPDMLVVPQYDYDSVYRWNAGDALLAGAIVWSAIALLDNSYDHYYGSCFDWNRDRFWWGPGYGNYGYWNDGWRNWRYRDWDDRRHRGHRPPPPPHREPPPHHNDHHHGYNPYPDRPDRPSFTIAHPIRTYDRNRSGRQGNYVAP